MPLDLTPRLTDVDDLYQLLVDAHADIDADQSLRVNARLILLLANHIGDVGVVAEAIAIATNGPADTGIGAEPLRQ